MFWFATLVLLLRVTDAIRYDCVFTSIPSQTHSGRSFTTNLRTCSTPYANMPIISCPEGWEMTDCRLTVGTEPSRTTASKTLSKRQKRALPQQHLDKPRPGVRRDYPDPGDCSTSSPCPYCRLKVTCQRLPPATAPPTTADPCAGVSSQTTCGGLTYEYVEHPDKNWERAASVVIEKIGKTRCQEYCDALCDCRSFVWIDEVFPADPPKCKIYIFEAHTDYLTSLSIADYYVKRVDGQLSDSWLLSSTGGNSNGWTTCDGQPAYSYYEVVGQTVANSGNMVEYLDNLSPSQCEVKCSQDCQCTAILHLGTGSGTCGLLMATVNQHMTEPISQNNNLKLFIRQVPGAPAPVFTGTCNGAAYAYLQYKYRKSTDYEPRIGHYILPTVNDCKARCSDYCHCKAFSAKTVTGGVRCEMFATVAREEILTLSYDHDYYVRQGPGDCPPDLAENCNGQTYSFTDHFDQTCASSYNLLQPVGIGFMHNRMQCEKICASRCDCEGYLYNVFQYEQTDNTCTIKGPGCVANLQYNPYHDYYDDSTSTSEIFYEK